MEVCIFLSSVSSLPACFLAASLSLSPACSLIARLSTLTKGGRGGFDLTMEAIAIAKGIPALLGACIKIADKIDAIKNSGVNSRNAVTRFQADKLLLERWAADVGIKDGRLLPAPNHHDALDDPAVVSSVEETLARIEELCRALDDSLRGLSSRPAILKPLQRMRTGDFQDNSRSAGSISSKMAKLGFALYGQAGAKLDQFGDLVKRLFELIPASDPALNKTLELLERQRNGR